MAKAVTIKSPDVVALIEQAATQLTDGNKTEGVALAVRRLLEADIRAGSLFDARRGSVRVRKGSISRSLSSTPRLTPRLAAHWSREG